MAAAIQANAAYIVTNNHKDFPQTELARYDVKPISPDKFVLKLIEADPEIVKSAAAYHWASLLRSPKTVEEYLASLEKQHLPKTVAFLRKHADEI